VSTKPETEPAVEQSEVDLAVERVVERNEQRAATVRQLQRQLAEDEFVKEYLALCLRSNRHIVGIPYLQPTNDGAYVTRTRQAPVEISPQERAEYERQIDEYTDRGITFAGE
jgi:hypothetical protein